MLQEEIYSRLDSLTKDELINIIIENQLFVSENFVHKITSKQLNIPFEKFRQAYDYKK